MKNAKSEPNKSMQNLRAILGKTQKEFAALIGVSIETIRSIEMGRLPVSEKTDLLIRAATGASLHKLKHIGGRKFRMVALVDGVGWSWIMRMLRIKGSAPSRVKL